MKKPHPSNWLKVVGTGIRLGQMTTESQRAVEGADRVFAVVTDEPALSMLQALHRDVVDLTALYALGKERLDTYREMVDQVVGALGEGHNVCFALYGHPAVFAYPSRAAVKRAREEGFEASILPGISAEDCIFADLEFDPAEYGCQSYSATSLLMERRQWDPEAVIVLWQLGIIGESRAAATGNRSQREALVARLKEVYGPAHPAIVYEAATLPFCAPDVRRLELSQLSTGNLRPMCTVVIPPRSAPNAIPVANWVQTAVWIS